MNPTSDFRWRVLTVVHTFNALTGLVGGAALAVWPDGRMMQAPLAMLQGTPFRDYLIPGLLLFASVGVTNMVAAFVAKNREPGGEVFSFIAGVVTFGWIAGELMVLRVFSPLQVLYALTGLVIMLDAGWIRIRARRLVHA